MSARQNKKQRKGRNNANNRERTVTTLTEDPNTPYLIPTPSEEPAGANMSSPFSVASSSSGKQTNMSSTGYQIPGNFGFAYNSYVGPIHTGVHHQHQQQAQQFFAPQLPQHPLLPPGQSDLEVLEKLKDMIKSGQHEFYRAVPQPAALASIYMGANTTPQSQVPHHPEQAPDLPQGTVMEGPSQTSVPTGDKGPPSPVDPGRRPPRIQNKEIWDLPNSRKLAGASTVDSSHLTNNVLSALSPDDSSSTNPHQFQQSSQLTQCGLLSDSATGAPSVIDWANINNKDNPLTGPVSTGVKADMNPPLDIIPSPVTASAQGGQDATTPSPRPARFDGLANHSRIHGDLPSSTNKPDLGRPPDDRLDHSGSTYGGPTGIDVSLSKESTFDVKEDTPRVSRDNSWSNRDRDTVIEDRRRESDRPPGSPTARSSFPGGVVGERAPLPGLPQRDDRYYDRDRDRERDRDRRDWDRERDRDRRPFDRFRDSRTTDSRRPPPEQRHYEPDYDRPPVGRRYDFKGPEEIPVSGRRLPDSRPPPPADDRLTSARPSSDSRGPLDTRLPPADTRTSLSDSRGPPPDSHSIRAPPSDDDRRKILPADDLRVLPTTENHVSRPPAAVNRPADGLVASRTGGDDRGGTRHAAGPPPPHEDRNSRSQAPQEERINSRPSLQDRLSQPPVSRPDPDRLSHRVSLEERLSHASLPSAELSGRSSHQVDARPVGGVPDHDRDRLSTRPSPPDERTSRGADTVRQDERPSRLDDRPGRPSDRYPRPASPPPPSGATPVLRPAVYPPPHASSVARDDLRASKVLPSPHRPVSRDYRPLVRGLSRERLEVRSGSYRPDVDRSYPDERKSDAMDVDVPRYNDNRPPYRPFSPPATDLARDRGRTHFQVSPPRVPVDTPSYDDLDRGYSGTGGRDWHYQYGERRRDWSTAEEENYWKTRPQWERNGPADRDRFDAPPPSRGHGWEPRDDRERRDTFTRAPSPPRSHDGPSRPLSSRLTDTYSSSAPGPGPAGDREYPLPRDIDRSRVPGNITPPYGRIRPRSPSPVRRPGPPVDDTRPPMKRPREDTYPSSGYYSPRDPARRPPGDYTSRASSPPPPHNSGNSFYDTRGPPPSSAGTASSALGDRDYAGRDRVPGLDYPTPPVSSAYDRSRSPGPLGAGRGYQRGEYTRDERRYTGPPPVPPSRRP